MITNKPSKLFRILLTLSYFLVFSIAISIIIGSLSLQANVPLTPVLFPAEVLIASFLTFLIFKKQSLQENLIAVTIGIGLIILCVFISSNFLDLSYDGMAYQKLAVGHLAHGWTPPKETVADFSRESPIRLAPTSQAIWLEHYAKGPWIFSASIYTLTHSIESSKILTFLLSVSLFLYLLFKFDSKNMDRVPAVLLSILIALPPVAISQISSFCVDGILAVSLYFLSASLLFALFDESKFSSDWLLYAASVIICCNTKFTGVPFALLFSGLIFTSHLCSKYIEKRATLNSKLSLKQFGYISTIFVFGILVIGGPVYIKNSVDHGNPFYPLMGRHATDIMSQFQPTSFSHTNNYKKFALAFFSHTGSETCEKFRLKIPGTFNCDLGELAPNSNSTRGGFGFLFSLIALGSMSYLIYLYREMNFTEKIMIVSFLLGCILLTGIISASWMARYTPYIYAIPLVTLYMAIVHNKKILWTLLSFTLMLNLLTFTIQPLYYCKVSNQVKQDLCALKSNQPVHVFLTNRYYTSIVYTLHDENISYIWEMPHKNAKIIPPLSLGINPTQKR